MMSKAMEFFLNWLDYKVRILCKWKKRKKATQKTGEGKF